MYTSTGASIDASIEASEFAGPDSSTDAGFCSRGRGIRYEDLEHHVVVEHLYGLRPAGDRHLRPAPSSTTSSSTMGSSSTNVAPKSGTSTGRALRMWAVRRRQAQLHTSSTLGYSSRTLASRGGPSRVARSTAASSTTHRQHGVQHDLDIHELDAQYCEQSVCVQCVGDEPHDAWQHTGKQRQHYDTGIIKARGDSIGDRSFLSSPSPSLFRPLLSSNWLGWGPPFARAVRVACWGLLAADPGRFARAPPLCLPLLRLTRGVQFHISWHFPWSPLFMSPSWRVLRTQIPCTALCRSCSGIGPRGAPSWVL